MSAESNDRPDGSRAGPAQSIERCRDICAEVERLSKIVHPTDADETYLHELQSEFAHLTAERAT